MRSIRIASDYSETPAGRYKSDGPDSGERFRDEFLIPAFQGDDLVEVDLDGTLGYGSSFLEEAFGGLVRNGVVSAKDLKRRLKIKSERKFYADRVWGYIEAAARQRA
jgi:hypothetical protein